MQMASMRRTIFIIIALFLAACTGQGAQIPAPTPFATLRAQPVGEPVTVGVLAIRSAVAANAQYGPIIVYLEEQLGRPVRLVPLSQDEQFVEAEKGNLDFTFNNPLAAVQIRRLNKTRFLATLSRTNTGPQFSGLIIARPDGEIKSSADLRGKRVTCVAFETAAAGCVFQIFYLLEKGIDPYTEFASFTETPSQDNIVLSVLNGTVDAGFIRTGQLEHMIDEGTLSSLDELFIVDRAQDDFFYPHTTLLYPEWPMAALAGTEPELVEQVRLALLAIPAGHPALTNADAVGFVEPVDYELLDDLIFRLKLRSWDAE